MRWFCPSLGDRRTEVDFVAHIAQTVANDPAAHWTFVLDQLNTHQSEGLVIWVAQHGQLTEDLGQKGKRGTLATMALISRRSPGCPTAVPAFFAPR